MEGIFLLWAPGECGGWVILRLLYVSRIFGPVFFIGRSVRASSHTMVTMVILESSPLDPGIMSIGVSSSSFDTFCRTLATEEIKSVSFSSFFCQQGVGGVGGGLLFYHDLARTAGEGIYFGKEPPYVFTYLFLVFNLMQSCLFSFGPLTKFDELL